MVSIAAFQAVDPGSIPGRRTFPFSFLFINSSRRIISIPVKITDAFIRKIASSSESVKQF